MTNIAVIGSREGFTQQEVINVIEKHFNKEHDRLITGGASGVDTYAYDYIDNNEDFYKQPDIIRPINTIDKINYLFRNVEIITKADKIIIFWNGKSKGTKFVIDYAKARNKNITMIIKNQQTL